MARRRKFQIPAVPSTTSKSIRFPNNIIEDVEKAIQGTTCNFSTFVIEVTHLALEDLKDKGEEGCRHQKEDLP